MELQSTIAIHHQLPQYFQLYGLIQLLENLIFIMMMVAANNGFFSPIQQLQMENKATRVAKDHWALVVHGATQVVEESRDSQVAKVILVQLALLGRRVIQVAKVILVPRAIQVAKEI